MLHINEHEAEKLLQRLHQEQKEIREQALNEEYEVKQRERILLSFYEPKFDKLNQFENELSEPSKNLPKQKFRKKSKFSFIMCNEEYNPDYLTHVSLPEVVNDFRNAMQTAQMMGIPFENIIQLRDASFDELEHTWTQFKDKITVFSRVLTDRTGIVSTSPG